MGGEFDRIDPVQRLIEALETAPLSDAQTLIASLGLRSQPTFSRLISRAGGRVVPVGRARARRYAAARTVPGLGSSWPIWRVDASGDLQAVGTLRAFAPRGYVLAAASGLAPWMAGRRADASWVAELPPFLVELLPFRVRNRRASGGLDGSIEPGETGESGQSLDGERLRWLVEACDDGPGDLVVGDGAARRLVARWAAEPAPIAASARSRAYPLLAQAAIEGALPAAPVGGERPAFAAIVERDGAPRQVVVEFSPSEYTDAARRLCDLLVCGHLVARSLAGHGLPAAETAIVEGGSRVFLESTRFDRVGARGRLALVSLQALVTDARSASAAGRGWTLGAQVLRGRRWIDAAVVEQLRLLETIARFLDDTDNDPARVSFLPRDGDHLQLGPVRALRPSGYEPVDGEVRPRRYQPPMPEPGHAAIWREAGTIARRIWRAIADDDRVSAAFRAIAADNAQAVDEVLGRFARVIAS